MRHRKLLEARFVDSSELKDGVDEEEEWERRAYCVSVATVESRTCACRVRYFAYFHLGDARRCGEEFCMHV